jgi:hypothetical protein
VISNVLYRMGVNYQYERLLEGESLVAGAGVSGSSPLVGSLFYLQKPMKREEPTIMLLGSWQQ